MTGMSSGRAAASGLPMTSSQQVRDQNIAVILDLFWDGPVDAGVTASELVEATGLTRATVLAVCDDLRDLDWLIEDQAPKPVAGRGRRARRFTFNRTRHLVVASDVGVRSVTSVVADLKGTILSRVRHSLEGQEWETDRTDHLIQTFQEALREADVPIERIEGVCIGVAAPVDRNGKPFPGSIIWDMMRVDLRAIHTYAPSWKIDIQNDADLAALAELRAIGPGAPNDFATLLASERFGAGLVINGKVIRGANGGAGEMDYLRRIKGVESAEGVAAIARDLARDAIAAGRHTELEHENPPGLGSVLVAAKAGDQVATTIVEQVVERLAIVISTLSNLVDPTVVIIAGGVAETMISLAPRIQSRLSEFVPHPPEVQTSKLGRDVVLLGAVWSATATIRLRAHGLKGDGSTLAG